MLGSRWRPRERIPQVDRFKRCHPAFIGVKLGASAGPHIQINAIFRVEMRAVDRALLVPHGRPLVLPRCLHAIIPAEVDRRIWLLELVRRPNGVEQIGGSQDCNCEHGHQYRSDNLCGAVGIALVAGVHLSCAVIVGAARLPRQPRGLAVVDVNNLLGPTRIARALAVVPDGHTTAPRHAAVGTGTEAGRVFGALGGRGVARSSRCGLRGRRGTGRVRGRRECFADVGRCKRGGVGSGRRHGWRESCRCRGGRRGRGRGRGGTRLLHVAAGLGTNIAQLSVTHVHVGSWDVNPAVACGGSVVAGRGAVEVGPA